MKTLNIPIMLSVLALFCTKLCAQIYTPYTYTPQGLAVYYNIVEETATETEILAYRRYLATTYPRAILLEDKTTTYNCHAYAWLMSEGGERCEMHSPLSYIDSGTPSYIPTSSNDLKGNKVIYFDGNNLPKHSAVVSTPSHYFISKWGTDGGLVKHLYYDCPYYDNVSLVYYKLTMEIMGDEVIALSSTTSAVTRTYMLSNVPQGATVDWSVIGNASIISGQGSNAIQVRINGSTTVVISATVNCPTGITVDIPFNLYVSASAAPVITDIEMFKYSQGTGQFTLKAISNNPEGNFSWSVSGGYATLSDVPYPDDAVFSDGPNQYKAINFYQTGTYTITVVGSRSGSADTYTYSKTFIVSESI